MAATRKSSGSVLRSLSPSGRFYNYRNSSSSASFYRSSSPTSRIKLHGSISPKRSVSIGGGNNQLIQRRNNPKRTCMCSPTTHPGSFRCNLHKGISHPHTRSQPIYSSNRLNARRSAMTNSIVRIGGVEGDDLVKRALSALIRPSSHQQKRRCDFRPKRSRLSVMTKAGEETS